MSYNGSGTFVINSTGQPVVTNTTISSTAFNALTADLATGLSTALTKDGQTTATANIPMGTKKLTGLGVGSANTDSITLGQSQAGGALFLTAAGTADVITATGAPTITAYATGNSYYFTATGANTTNVTLNVDSLGAKAVTKNGSTALVAGDIPSGAEAHVVYDGTRFQLINPVGAGFSMPQNSQSANYTTVLGDAGKHIFHPSTDANNRTFTIDSNANVAYTIGTIMRFENQSVNTLTLAITADTLTLEPGGQTISIVIGTNDSVDVLKVGTTNWVARRTAARSLAVNSQSANYTTVLSDMGKFLLHPTADNNPRTFTIDSNANVAYPVGTELVFQNQINTLTVAITTDTLTLLPDATTGSISVPATSQLRVMKVAATSWVATYIGTAGTKNTGTSGATVPLLNAANTWSSGATQTFTLDNATNAGWKAVPAAAAGSSAFIGAASVGSAGPQSMVWWIKKTTGIAAATAIDSGQVQTGCACLCWVFGKDQAANNRFADLVWAGGTTATLVSGINTQGAPTARTYSVGAGSLKLAMAAGTYDTWMHQIIITDGS